MGIVVTVERRELISFWIDTSTEEEALAGYLHGVEVASKTTGITVVAVERDEETV